MHLWVLPRRLLRYRRRLMIPLESLLQPLPNIIRDFVIAVAGGLIILIVFLDQERLHHVTQEYIACRGWSRETPQILCFQIAQGRDKCGTRRLQIL